MKIKQAYVTFEQAKWLKGNKWMVPTINYYFEDSVFVEYSIKGTNGYYGDEYEVELEEFYTNWNDKSLTKKNGDRCFGCSKDRGYFETYSAPEQWQVIEWLRVEHGIFISIEPTEKRAFKFNIYTDKVVSVKNIQLATAETPQGAYSEAFDYLINNNLI